MVTIRARFLICLAARQVLTATHTTCSELEAVVGVLACFDSVSSSLPSGPLSDQAAPPCAARLNSQLEKCMPGPRTPMNRPETTIPKANQNKLNSMGRVTSV
jgi:hypothetical protein